ncbi:unnamed protein product [Auanema sp. JU1783]|nr:unnamed protein product [Auanema sp. JU1783]
MFRQFLFLCLFVGAFLVVSTDAQSFEDGVSGKLFYIPRFRRGSLNFNGHSAYLQQLLQNLKPRFRRSD